MLAPVAAKLGIDLIWFGVLIGANMQTSVMHPPFGFALFYLRGVAPPDIKTKDIYIGAIPWVFLQLLLVAILIFFPEIVTSLLDKTPTIDPESIQQLDIPGFDDAPPLDLEPPKFE
jgi:TRAP-type mannitol/chloroaromatic compound transport system permease large subunit